MKKLWIFLNISLICGRSLFTPQNYYPEFKKHYLQEIVASEKPQKVYASSSAEIPSNWPLYTKVQLDEKIADNHLYETNINLRKDLEIARHDGEVTISELRREIDQLRHEKERLMDSFHQQEMQYEKERQTTQVTLHELQHEARTFKNDLNNVQFQSDKQLQSLLDDIKKLNIKNDELQDLLKRCAQKKKKLKKESEKLSHSLDSCVSKEKPDNQSDKAVGDKDIEKVVQELFKEREITARIEKEMLTQQQEQQRIVKELQDQIATFAQGQRSLKDENEELQAKNQVLAQAQKVDNECVSTLSLAQQELEQIKKERDLLKGKLDKKRNKCARMKKELEDRVKLIEDEKKNIAAAKDNQMESFLQMILNMKR